MKDYVRSILAARVYDVAVETALDEMAKLGKRLGRRILLKREDMQPIFSFKLRGAFNRMSRLGPDELKRGVVCASAGNHAQGVALAAQSLGTEATVVMPKTTPAIKVDAVRSLGACIVLEGDAFDGAYVHARRLERERRLTFIHPYDDPDVIAGQGTIGVEILRQYPGPIEALFLPVGGGGLAAGVASYVKFVRPNVKIFGIEPSDAASMSAAIAAGRPVRIEQVGIFADGLAVGEVGLETFRICRDLIDGFITVSTDEICAAVKDIFDDTRAVAEPAGAVALAGLKRWTQERAGRKDGALIAINSGANLNFDRLRHIAERAEVGKHREALLGVAIPERPGSYLRFMEVLEGRSITEFNYRYAESGAAKIFVGVQLLEGGTEKRMIIDRLQGEGYAVQDLSDNEMAKLHVRYMVGGRVVGLKNERIYRFEFPERPGALLRFLEDMPRDWNITLFHYRNHGAAYGRVLCGIQVLGADRSRFDQFLADLGYTYWDETSNPAYSIFLDGLSGWPSN